MWKGIGDPDGNRRPRGTASGVWEIREMGEMTMGGETMRTAAGRLVGQHEVQETTRGVMSVPSARKADRTDQGRAQEGW